MRNRKIRFSRRIGIMPGAIIQDTSENLPPVELTLFRYDADKAVREKLSERKIIDLLPGDREVLWLDVSGVHDARLLEEVSDAFSVHPIVSEDIQHTIQRPKAEEYGGQLFFILRMLSWDAEKRSINSEQVSIVCGEGYVISFQEHPGDVFDPVRRRIIEGRGRVRQMGADYLAYALADAVVDNYFLVLEALQEEFETLEDRVLFGDGGDPSERVHAMTGELLSLRRAVWPMREAASTLIRGQIPAVSAEVQVFFRDIYDHIVQIMDWVELMRESLKGLVDSHQTKVSNSTNAVMRVLTIVATIFIPLTFIAGVYGMNFSVMPELSWPFGYPLVLILMAAVAVGMLLFFKRKKWL
jgi:magnesium transporter